MPREKASKKRLKACRFLEEYDMNRTTFDRLRHRFYDPLPAVKIEKNVFVDMVEYPKWEQRQNLKANLR